MAFDFSKIKGLFIVTDENPTPPAAGGNAAATNKPSTPSAPSVPAAPVVAGAVTPEATDKFLKVLFGAMEQANLPGLDYLEFKQSLNSLAKMPMDEQVRFQSAYAMAQSMGATAPKLMESAAHYVNVLKGEESKFQQALLNQQKEQIGNREQTIRSLDAAVKEKADLIKKLTQEMEQHRQQAEHLRKEIGDDTAKVETTKANFVAAFQLLTGQILQDVESMKKYLK